MFHLLRWLIGLALLAALAYFAATVPLGKLTLWEHLKAIAGTRESHELIDGVKGKAGEALRRRADARPTLDGADRLTPAERKELRKLIRKQLGAGTAQGGRAGTAQGGRAGTAQGGRAGTAQGGR